MSAKESLQTGFGLRFPCGPWVSPPSVRSVPVPPTSTSLTWNGDLDVLEI